jgi:hypothetical protein
LKRDLADELSSGDLVALTERDDPVLADLWDNPKGAAYDNFNRAGGVLVKFVFADEKHAKH